jgi:prepilin-type N-terminal cleavage/methylation domain-containing protein
VRGERLRSERGFSLVEVLIASTILVVALLSLAQVLSLAAAANGAAGRATFSAVLAAEKLEELHTLTWESVRRQAGESVDYLDRSGRPIRGAAAATYGRRWVIDPLPVDPDNSLVIQVIVSGRRDEARIAGVRTRKAP